LILIGIGSNLPGPRFGTPRDNCEGSLVAMADKGIRLLRRSRWYTSAPVPAADVPWYVNGVAAVETPFDPVRILSVLHRIEDDFGRVRGAANAPRSLDLDLLAFHDDVSDENAAVIVPHPRMHERAFVLMPLREIAPDWRHPVFERSVGDLIAELPPEQVAVAIDDGA
jgi:2-amino-4-hydroxy-6-hydroxymethyldihydropteridine diphosphokinase